MTNGVSYIMDEYQTLYDNYVKQMEEKDARLVKQQEQMVKQREQLAAKDIVITSAISALVASGKSAEEIAALLNIPVDNVRKLINNNL